MAEFKEVMLNVLYIVVTGAVPILTAYLVSLLKTKKAQIVEKADNDYVATQLDRVGEIVLSAVSAVSQTYTDALKKEGKFTKQAQAEAFEKAKDAVVDLVSDEAIELIDDLYGDFDKFLENKIEETILLLKKQ